MPSQNDVLKQGPKMQSLDIYIIEDDIELATSMARLLAPVGYPIKTLECARGFKPDLMTIQNGLFIVDLHLLSESGVDFIRRVQSKDAGFGYLVHSATATVSVATALMKEHALGLIEKPADPERLIAEVKKGVDYVRERRRLISRIAPLDERLACLSKREQEVLFFAAVSTDAQMIADRIGCSKRTVDSHRLMINQKLGRAVSKDTTAALNSYLLKRTPLRLPKLDTLDVDTLVERAVRTAPQLLH